MPPAIAFFHRIFSRRDKTATRAAPAKDGVVLQLAGPRAVKPSLQVSGAARVAAKSPRLSTPRKRLHGDRTQTPSNLM